MIVIWTYLVHTKKAEQISFISFNVFLDFHRKRLVSRDIFLNKQLREFVQQRFKILYEIHFK